MSNNYITRFKRDLNKCEVCKDDLVIAACSGGADSMLLLHALKKADQNFEVAHVNFLLRGSDSDADAKSVQFWCDKNGITCHINELNAQQEAEKSGGGIQKAARKLRYDWFERLCLEREGYCIAVAHHEKDQAETLIIQLLRSVNPSALGCMPLKSGNIIRPFLEWSREEIDRWIALDQVEFREDSSNSDSKYTRNRVRHEVLPLLESIRAGSTKHLAEWASRLRIQNDAVDYSMREASRDIIKFNDSESANGELCRLDLEKLGKSPWGPAVIDRLLAERGWPHGSRTEVTSLRRSTIGAEIIFNNDSIVRERDFLVLKLNNTTVFPENKHIIYGENGSCPGLEWSLQEKPIEPTNSLNLPVNHEELWLDFELVKKPLIWRRWQDGDRIQPTGMEGTVNISDLLTQWKVPNLSRPYAQVLLDETGEILWVWLEFEGKQWSRISRVVVVTRGSKTWVLAAHSAYKS